MQRTQTNPRTEIVPVLRVVVAKEGGMTNSYELAQGIVRFGRSPEADVRLEGKNISRVHCILEVRDGNLWVRDNDSLNGIFVNGEKVKEAIVTARDGVKVGPYRFKALLTGTTVVPRSEARAVVPAAKANEEMDRTLPAFDAKAAKAALKSDGPLPKEEQPLRSRTSSSASVVLEEFQAPIMGTEDQTPADGTPVASPAQAIAPAITVKAPEIVPAAAPVAKPSYRSSFESAKKAEAPKAEPVVKAEAPRAPVPQRGRMSLTSSGVKRAPGVLKAGDTCPSCSTGSMLTWQGALKCRKCGNTAELGSSAAKSSAPSMSARSESISAKIEEPSAQQSSIGEQKLGEICDSCSKGRMLTWEGGLKCRSCGNQSARAESTVVSSSRPAMTPRTPAASRPSVVTNPAASAAPKSASGTLQVGELCGACYKGRMLTWEGSLKCRSCGNTAEMGTSSKAAKATVEVKPASLVAAAKPAASRTMSSSEVREPNRTAAIITGVGLFLGFYMTVGVCAIASALLV